jgi:RNA polymerase sigma factor (sigma-70 family)
MLNFQDLYEAYAADVYRFSLWMTGSMYEADDITSETFIRAWARKSTIRTETLKGYLLMIARNIYLGKVRKQQHQVYLDDQHPDPLNLDSRFCVYSKSCKLCRRSTARHSSCASNMNYLMPRSPGR